MSWRSDMAFAMRLIIAATDGSEGAGRAIDVAAALAKSCAARLLLMTVESTDLMRSRPAETLALAEGVGLGDVLERAEEELLRGAKERALRQGATSVEVQACWGDPAEAVIETAQRTAADLVVVGRRGRGRLAGLLLGSVSQKLVSLAPCPVMVVP
jgi:nucleotide-binding universal stress UspA family protein